METNSVCSRCNGISKEIKKSKHPVCFECYLVTGPRKRSDDEICVYCGDKWVKANTMICTDCLYVESLNNYVI